MTLPRLRERPGVVGAALMVGGVGVHVVFAIWVSPYAGRMEWGLFSCFEGWLFILGLSFLTLQLILSTPPSTGKRATGCGLIALLGFISGILVLIRLPP